MKRILSNELLSESLKELGYFQNTEYYNALKLSIYNTVSLTESETTDVNDTLNEFYNLGWYHCLKEVLESKESAKKDEELSKIINIQKNEDIYEVVRLKETYEWFLKEWVQVDEDEFQRLESNVEDLCKVIGYDTK